MIIQIEVKDGSKVFDLSKQKDRTTIYWGKETEGEISLGLRIRI